MEYLVDGTKFELRYSELKKDYQRFCAMLDEEFLQPQTLLEVLHFCCVCGYLKELSNEELISDKGVIHELTHLLTRTSRRSVRDIRSQFEQVMKLA